jgi:predicted dienelactone hydrolase
LRPDAPPYALHGPYWVGLKDTAITFEYVDGTIRESRVSVWYPALNPGGELQPYEYLPERRVLDYSGNLYLPRTMTALLDAEPDMAAAPYPVVIFSHGGWAYRWHLLGYVENLASHGFVVIATDHEDAPPDWVMTGHKELTRQWDVRALIDYAGQITAADGMLPGVADVERVGETGYSAGGFTALLAGGARRSAAAKAEWCALDATIFSWVGPLLCTDASAREQEWATLLGIDQPTDGLWPDIGDPRVDAIVSIDGGAFDFGPEGLDAIRVPALLFFARGAPGEMPYPLDTLFDALKHDKEVVAIFEYANHALFSPLCREGELSAQTVGD